MAAKLLAVLNLDLLMRHKLILASLLLNIMIPAAVNAEVSIGINLALYPNLVRVPGYPVYYAPQMDANYFFYEGRYWVYTDDSWYAASWYNGPWEMVDSEIVPLYVLRIPVRYYRQPPSYFRGWSAYSPPRWGEHWGNGWAQQHRDWDHWDRRAMPPAAPLPAYQRHYPGNQYPRVEQQLQLQKTNYQYQPRRAPAQHVDDSQQRRNNASVLPAPAAQPTQSTGSNDPGPNQHGEEVTVRRPNEDLNQRNTRKPVPHQQPVIQAPRTPLPATQQPAPEQRPVPVAKPGIQPPARQSEQRAVERQRPTVPRVEEPVSRDRVQPGNERQRRQPQGERERDRD